MSEEEGKVVTLLRGPGGPNKTKFHKTKQHFTKHNLSEEPKYLAKVQCHILRDQFLYLIFKVIFS